MILKKVEGRRNPRAWHGSRLTVSGLHGHPSTPNPRPKRRVETPGDPWGVPQPPGPFSPAYGTPPTANRWFLPLSSSQWGQTLRKLLCLIIFSQVDEIKHGPPFSYSENVFEKRDQAIRGKSFQQENQLARS